MSQLLLMWGAVALAGTVHSAAGFGSALVAMPLLTLIAGVRTAAPMQGLFGLFTSLVLLYQYRRALHLREARWLVAGALLGMPAGILVLKRVDPAVVTGWLGALLIAFALFALAVPPPARPLLVGEIAHAPMRLATLAAGLCSGMLAGAYTTGGPPLVVFGVLRGWPKEEFRTILQTCFICNGFAVVAAHAATGLTNGLVLRNAVLCMPALILGILLGRFLDRFLPPSRFRPLVLCLILVLGVSLLAS